MYNFVKNIFLFLKIENLIEYLIVSPFGVIKYYKLITKI